MRTILYFLLILTYTKSITQSIYYSDSERLAGLDIAVEIGLFNFSNCTNIPLWLDTTQSSSQGGIGYIEWYDLALCPNGELYGLGRDGIYELDLISNNHIKLLQPMPPMRFWNKGLFCTKDTVLIFGERDIGSYHLNSGDLVYHGRLPHTTAIWSNIFWYNGKLMASGNTQVVELNLADIPNSTILCDFPMSGLRSLFEVSHSCDSTTVFAIFTFDVFVLNPMDCSLTHYCSIPSFEGTTPNFMYMHPPPCEIHLDLDAFDETAPGIDYRDTIYCQLPEKYLFSLTDLFSDKDWDSLHVWIDQGPSGIALSGLSPSFAVLHGQQTTSLNYYPTSLSDFTALGPYLNDLSLSGAMPDGVTNVRIGFTGYADYLVSDTAFAYITLIGRSSHAGRDSSAVVCKNDFSFSLPALLSGDATAGGIWSPSGSFDPKDDDAGIYQYIVSEAVCPDDTAFFLMNIYPEPIFDLGPDQLQCPGDSNILSVDVENVDIIWSSGENGNEIVVTSPQILNVEIIDQFDCHYYDSLEILIDDECIISTLYIPNIFSPNGDGFNDTWGIASAEVFRRITVTVFDRWGNMLYFTDKLPFTWDGISRENQMANPGVYTYVFELVTLSDNKYVKKGNVTLVR